MKISILALIGGSTLAYVPAYTQDGDPCQCIGNRVDWIGDNWDFTDYLDTEGYPKNYGGVCNSHDYL